jgi:polyhydroxybutyrate depolymerase
VAACELDGLLPGAHDREVAVGDLSRHFVIEVPDLQDPPAAWPVVFSFHGLGQDSTRQRALTGLHEVAGDEGFLVVSPDGTGERQHWAIRADLDPATGDAAFVDAMLADLRSLECIDDDRIYATGISNGAGFTSALACSAPRRFAAVATVAGLGYQPGCEDDPAIPLLTIHGTADTIIPYEGGVGFLDVVYPAAEAQAAQWATHNGCTGEPVVSEVAPSVELLRWDGCTEAVEMYRVEGGHNWPGSPLPDEAFLPALQPVNRDLDASRVIWEFFEAHPQGAS